MLYIMAIVQPPLRIQVCPNASAVNRYKHTWACVELGWVTLGTLEICIVAIQLVLCMQLETLCIQLRHLYSAPKLLEKASFKLELQYECSVLPRIF